MKAIKPLTLVLKAEFFDAFKDGTKGTEYRRRGKRYNAETCFIGRPVVLLRGYTCVRLTGRIDKFSYDTIPSRLPGWTKCYGRRRGDAACIGIEVDRV